MQALQSNRQYRGAGRWFTVVALAALVFSGVFGAAPTAHAASLLSANFDADTNGFTYADDTFGTTAPSYASGARTTAGGYSSTGGLQVTLGGVDATDIAGMSGGWSYTLNTATAQTGVSLAFRYKLAQTAHYEYDEFSRVRVKVDGVELGRGAKSYVDHVGGDGSSTDGGSSDGNADTFSPTTDWQLAELYVGAWAAGNHTIVLGGYNNKKTESDESTTLVIDDVTVTSDNPAPTQTAAQTLAGRVDYAQFLTNLQGIAQYRDRCRGASMGCTSYDSSANPAASSSRPTWIGYYRPKPSRLWWTWVLCR